jgi:hypothetical protein
MQVSAHEGLAWTDLRCWRAKADDQGWWIAVSHPEHPWQHPAGQTLVQPFQGVGQKRCAAVRVIVQVDSQLDHGVILGPARAILASEGADHLSIGQADSSPRHPGLPDTGLVVPVDDVGAPGQLGQASVFVDVPDGVQRIDRIGQ